MTHLTKIEAVKRFFAGSERPVSNKELTDLKSADPKGFDEIALAAMAALDKTEQAS